MHVFYINYYHETKITQKIKKKILSYNIVSVDKVTEDIKVLLF